MINDSFENIVVPSNIDKFIDDGVKKARKRRRRQKERLFALVSSIIIISLGVVNTTDVKAFYTSTFDKIYKTLGFDDKYTSAYKYCGKSIESNGVKVTVDKIAASRYFVRMAIRIESCSELDNFWDSCVSAQVGDMYLGSSGGVYDVDNNTRIEEINIINNDGFPNEATINLKINSSILGINEVMPIDIDFVDTEKMNLDKKVYTDKYSKMNISGEIHATNNGSMLVINKFTNEDYNLGYLLNIDGKLYRNDNGNADNKSINAIFSGITIDDIKNAKNISLILEKSNKQKNEQFICEENIENRKQEYLNQIKEYKESYLRLPSNTKDNINYVSEITSKEGEKVYVKGVKRINDNVRVVIESENKNRALDVVKGLEFYYNNYLENLTMEIEEYDKFMEYRKNKEYDSDSYKGEVNIWETDKGYIVETVDKVREGEINLKFNNILLYNTYEYEEIKLNLE